MTISNRRRAPLAASSGDGAVRRTAKGGSTADADRSRPAGARLVRGALRGGRLHRHVDDMGNIFARRPGRDSCCRPSRSAAISTPSRPAAIRRRDRRAGRAGSPAHAERAGIETEAPIEVIDWTNEEGSASPRPCCPPACSPASSPATTPMPRGPEGETSVRRWTRSAIAARACGAQARRVFRAAYRAGPDPGGRGQDDRHCHRRAGHALVRGHPDRADSHAGTRRCSCARTRCWRPRMVQAVQAIGLAHAPDAVGTVGLIEAGRTAATWCRARSSSPSISATPGFPDAGGDGGRGEIRLRGDPCRRQGDHANDTTNEERKRSNVQSNEAKEQKRNEAKRNERRQNR